MVPLADIFNHKASVVDLGPAYAVAGADSSSDDEEGDGSGSSDEEDDGGDSSDDEGGSGSDDSSSVRSNTARARTR